MGYGATVNALGSTNPKKNAPSVAAEQGVEALEEGANLRDNHTSNADQFAMWKSSRAADQAAERHYRREHQAAARMLAHALTLSDEAGWDGFTTLIGIRLSVKERVALAFAALMALDDYHAFLAAEAALWGIVRPDRGATNV